ncbi:MAG: hypothetical protein KDC38_06485 [Planctomycetes bacterium]|nr:hypothetical protein [Planctomycetota bacterium]
MKDPFSGIADSRQAAIAVTVHWQEHPHVFVEKLLGDLFEATRFETRDRAFITEISYGYVRRLNTLEALIAHFARRPADEVDLPVRVTIALGLYQFLYLETPPHAAVDATLAGFRRHAERYRIGSARVDRSAGLINAVLRRATREVTRVPLDAADPEDADLIRGHQDWIRVPGLNLPGRNRNVHARWAVQYSHPQEMVRLWHERYPEQTLIEILIRDNERPTTHLVLRADGPSPDSFIRRLGVAGVVASRTGVSRTLALESPGRIESIPGYDAGEFWVQDVTARRLSLMLPRRDDVRLLDLCAAPGGKLISLLDRGPFSEVLACDVSEERLRRVAENLDRVRLADAPVRAAELPDDPDRIRFDHHFDQILVDAPCSNTGVLNRRQEARWRFVPEVVRELVQLQKGLLRAALRHAAPSAQVLYTTCSIEPDENNEVVHDVLRSQPDFQLVEEREVLPGEGGGDGGYGALIQRRR